LSGTPGCRTIQVGLPASAGQLSSRPLGGSVDDLCISQDMNTWFPSHLAAILFVVASLLWAACEVFNTYGFRLRRRTAIIERSGQGSYWIILLVVWGSVFISFLVRALDLGVFHNGLQLLGVGMVLAGVVFREWAVLSLGRFFTTAVLVASDQALVRRGPYRWLRHPSYSGSILTLVGFPLAVGTWLGGLLVLVLCLVGYSYRAEVEEKVLLKAFGDEYRDYMQRTWRFFPWM
jgi:protein-S-isoprenylcysteine O-methyltransferase Ste14